MINTFGGVKPNNTLEEIVETLSKKETYVIFVSEKPPQDAVAASLALYLGLLKSGKDAYLVSSSKIDYNLPGVEKFQGDLSIKGDSLKIAFPYKEGSVDKVDWGIDGETFYITIKPTPGYPKLDPSQVKFSYTGGTADCFVMVGVPTFNSLGQIYSENKEVFQGVEIVNIDRNFGNARYGSLNYVDTTVSSLSEIIYMILKNLEVEIESDIATNLYAGILSATNNFTGFNVKPETLEMAAELLRKGAKKTITRPVTQTFISQPKFSRLQTGLQQESKTEQTVSTTQTKSESTPQDWLKPKIFTGKKI